MDKVIIVKFINVGGIFGFKEDTLISINEELYKYIDSNQKGAMLLKYILFGETEEDLSIDVSSTVPNVQVSMMIDGVEFHAIRMPEYVKNDGKATLVKELISYKYGDKEIKSISNEKYKNIILDALGIIKF